MLDRCADGHSLRTMVAGCSQGSAAGRAGVRRTAGGKRWGTASGRRRFRRPCVIPGSHNRTLHVQAGDSPPAPPALDIPFAAVPAYVCTSNPGDLRDLASR